MNECDTRGVGRNTAFLLLRMLVSFAVDVIAVRIVLGGVGAESYGMFCAIAGVVALAFFLENVLFQTARRFMSVGLADGRKDDFQTVFSAVCGLTSAVAAVVSLLGGGLSVWFVRNGLSLPGDSLSVATTVCLLCIGTGVVRLLQVPFDAWLFAAERLDLLCGISLVESVLALASAGLVLTMASHRVACYAAFLLGTAIVRFLLGMFSCRTLMPGIRLTMCLEFERLKRQSAFFSWSILNALVNMLKGNGVGILVNVFAGVPYSASWKVAWEFGALVGGVTGNFHHACFPRAVMLWAAGRLRALQAFTQWSMVVSFVVAVALGLPLAVFADWLMQQWLGECVPPSAAAFARCVVVFYLFDALSGPLTTVIQATGRIARYQVFVSLVSASGFVFALAALCAGWPAWSAVASVALANALSFGYRVFHVCRWVGFSPRFAACIGGGNESEK